MSEKININTADKSTLCSLNGIGPALAKKVIAFRKKNGRFKKTSDLKKVPGMPSDILSENRGRVVLTNKEASKSKTKKKSKKKRKKTKTVEQEVREAADEILTNLIRKGFDFFGRKIKKKQSAKPKAVIIRRVKKEKKKTNPIAKLKKKSSSTSRLSNDQIISTAKKLKIRPAALKAVIEVESSGQGFLSNGNPKILFEGHVFWRSLQALGISPSKYQKGNEDILYRKWTKQHYIGGEKEYQRLARAMKINEDAALNSASWGMFQIMGFNYKAAGFSSVTAFVSAQKKSEKEQLQAFLNFTKKKGLLRYLRSCNWEAFARGYNGAGFKKNKYDTKMEKAFKKYKKIM